MRIFHISDLHFGRENPKVVETLLREIDQVQPSVVVVSGDLTQRARRSQFKKAAHFLQRITCPTLVVPGNHDVPLYDVTRRFLAPFNRYVRYINADFFPIYQDKLATIIGINTAYSFTWKSGRVTGNQLRMVAEKLMNMGECIKILVVHHPYHEIFSRERHHESLSTLGLDMILSGHLHRARAQVLDDHIERLNYKTLIVQAGTTLSTRLRGENNSYNLIEIHSKDHLTIKIKEYLDQSFQEKSSTSFVKQEGKWLLSAN